MARPWTNEAFSGLTERKMRLLGVGILRHIASSIFNLDAEKKIWDIAEGKQKGISQLPNLREEEYKDKRGQYHLDYCMNLLMSEKFGEAELKIVFNRSLLILYCLTNSEEALTPFRNEQDVALDAAKHPLEELPRTKTICSLATTCLTDHEAYPFLADALGDELASEEVIQYCRTGPYFRGNWVLDSILKI